MAIGATLDIQTSEPELEQASLTDLDLMKASLHTHKVRNGHSMNCHYAIYNRQTTSQLGWSIDNTVATIKEKLIENGITYNNNYRFRLHGSIYSGDEEVDNLSMLIHSRIHSRMYKTSRMYYLVLDYT